MVDYVGDDVEYGNYSSTAGGSVNLYSHFGIRYGGFLKIWESIYLKTQLYQSTWYALIHRWLLIVEYRIINLQSTTPERLDNKESPKREQCLDLPRNRR